MIDVSTDDFPPFLEEEFERMRIPGDEKGFAISFSSSKGKECVACGFHGDTAIAIRYAGDEYALKCRKPIALEAFEELLNTVPNEVKKSGFIGAEDLLDGEAYLVKWSWQNQTTRLVLCNPRHIEEENIRQLAFRLDEVMKKANQAKISKRGRSSSPLQKLSTGDRE